MSIIKNEDIIGYRIDQETVCNDCIKEAELSEVKLNDVMTERYRDDDTTVFCDRCKEQI